MGKHRPFWDWKVVTEKGCWEWIGSKRHYGYGQVTFNGRPGRKAHRVAWELTRGKIPGDLCVLHRCDNTACINPDHLFLGTQLDNIQDMNAKGRHGRTWHMKQQAHCHPEKPNHSHGLCKICAQRLNRALKRSTLLAENQASA
jgi:hypothetical protein